MKNDNNVFVLNKILVAIYILIALFGLNVLMEILNFGTLRKLVDNDVKSSETDNNDSDNDYYDVSMMDSVNLSKLLTYFDNGGEYVVYVGRSTCSACVAFLPTLQQAQDEFGYKTVYLDVTTVSESSNDFKTFKKKLDLEYTANLGDGTTTKAFGEYFGVTPMTFIIRNGKMVAGSIGAEDIETFEKFLTDNGVKKK